MIKSKHKNDDDQWFYEWYKGKSNIPKLTNYLGRAGGITPLFEASPKISIFTTAFEEPSL